MVMDLCCILIFFIEIVPALILMSIKDWKQRIGRWVVRALAAIWIAIISVGTFLLFGLPMTVAAAFLALLAIWWVMF